MANSRKKRAVGESSAALPSQPAAPTDSGQNRRRLLVVGIGASAGGLDAFKKFFSAMPCDSGMAFVLIPHLDPSHRSLMVELLSRQTQMPVCEAEHGMRLKPNSVYIIPPDSNLTIMGGRLRLTRGTHQQGFEVSLDQFFRSLAEDQQEQAIGIILSGTGSHGTSGLKEIKRAGGMIMAQDPATAQYDQMPRSAIEFGLPDLILSPEQMPQALISYARQPYLHSSQSQSPKVDSTEQISPVLEFLRARHKYDFRFYRKNTLVRRILRRMRIWQIDQIAVYCDYLAEHPAEVTALYNDLLIGVTSFFRDAEAFRELELQVITELAERQTDDIPVRVWVPACATGEEAYSIAILLLERFAAAKKAANVQIFASDIDDKSVEIARRGVYPASIVNELAPERIKNFFVKIDENHYQVNKQLRGSIIVTRQNVISDAPFSKLDLISCRNLLIYLEPEMQQKILRLFHFALNERGILFLGCSESIGRTTDIFEPVSNKWRIFRRSGPVRRDLMQVPILPTSDRRMHFPARASPPRPRLGFTDLMSKLLLARYAPAAVLVNRNYEILSLYGRTSDYLVLPTGDLTRDLMSLLHRGLKTKIRAAFHKVLNGGDPQATFDSHILRSGSRHLCTITVSLLDDPEDAKELLLVAFQDRVDNSPPDRMPALESEEESAVIRQLEHEVENTREDLQSSIEELQSSNEEVTSINEELQSSNEELETSKEELQSFNEELSTVNSQLQSKVDELEEVNSDFRNLLNSTEIATLFLDTDLRIRRFTPSTVQLLSLIESDVGRPIRDFAIKFADQTLLQDAGRVLDTATSVETEVRSETGRYFLRRILPYRSGENRINGVVLTFVDITEQKAKDAALAKSERRLRSLIETAADAIITVNDQGVVESFNTAAEQMFGYARQEIIGQNCCILMSAPYRGEFKQFISHTGQTGEVHLIGFGREVVGLRKDGSLVPVDLAVSEMPAREQNTGTQRLFTGIIRDISERKALQSELLTIADEEQRRIGHALHDELGQELTGLDLIVSTLADALHGHRNPEIKLALKASETIKRVLGQVRAKSLTMIPVDIDDAKGLITALDALATHIQQQFGVKCEFVCDKSVRIHNCVTATNLYRIAQESLTNAIKHGHASSTSISLKQINQQIELQIRDNGVGFDDQNKKLPSSHGAGIGLRIMRYRASVINATFQITRAPEKGTIVTCALPAEPQRRTVQAGFANHEQKLKGPS